MARQGPRFVDLRFPTGGVVKRTGYQNQAPYTTPAAVNVRPFDSLEGRERGGSRPGTVKAFSSTLNVAVQMLRGLATVDSYGTITERLVAIAGGAVYLSSGGSISALSGSVNTDAPTIQSAPHTQKLYVADYRYRVSNAGTIASTNQLSSDNVADWTLLGINTATDCVMVDNGNLSESNVFLISSIAPTHVELSGTLTNGACFFELGRVPMVVDPALGTMSRMVATAGIPPLNCPLICTYRDRLVLGGPGGTWYMSRAGDPCDWDYGAYEPDAGLDEARPMASSNYAGGEISDPLTAIVPHSDDYLIFGTGNALYVLRGDPAAGGQVDTLSREIGIVSANAWAHLPDGSTLILSRGGLFVVPAGAGVPIPFSVEMLPTDLVDVNTSANVVAMCYDAHYRGVHIHVTPTGGTAGVHWWIDWANKRFWPVSFPTTKQPRCAVSFAASAAVARKVLLGCADGYIREYSDSATTDDGTAITSSIVYGPIKVGQSGSDGMVSHLAADLDASSGNVSWALKSGATSEDAVTAVSAEVSGTFVAGASRESHPRVRGAAVALELSATSRWAIENVAIGVLPGGRAR